MNTGNKPPDDEKARVLRNVERARALSEEDRWRLLTWLTGYAPGAIEAALDHVTGGAS